MGWDERLREATVPTQKFHIWLRPCLVSPFYNFFFLQNRLLFYKMDLNRVVKNWKFWLQKFFIFWPLGSKNAKFYSPPSHSWWLFRPLKIFSNTTKRPCKNFCWKRFSHHENFFAKSFHKFGSKHYLNVLKKLYYYPQTKGKNTFLAQPLNNKTN